MPTHVYANKNEIVSKASEGKTAAAFPDVCFSPPSPPVGPVPLPYPNTAEAKNLAQGTTKVFIKDKMAGMESSSYLSKSMGDEPATQSFPKGLLTVTLQGKAYFTSWSMNVKLEGKGAPRHLDMTTGNHASQPGNTPPIPHISSMSPPPPQHPDRVCDLRSTAKSGSLYCPLQ